MNIKEKNFWDEKQEIKKKRDELYMEKKEMVSILEVGIELQDSIVVSLDRMFEEDPYLLNDSELMDCYNTIKGKAFAIIQGYGDEYQYLNQKYKDMEKVLDELELECDRHICNQEVEESDF